MNNNEELVHTVATMVHAICFLIKTFRIVMKIIEMDSI